MSQYFKVINYIELTNCSPKYIQSSKHNKYTFIKTWSLTALRAWGPPSPALLQSVLPGGSCVSLSHPQVHFLWTHPENSHPSGLRGETLAAAPALNLIKMFLRKQPRQVWTGNSRTHSDQRMAQGKRVWTLGAHSLLWEMSKWRRPPWGPELGSLCLRLRAAPGSSPVYSGTLWEVLTRFGLRWPWARGALAAACLPPELAASPGLWPLCAVSVLFLGTWT